MSRVRTYELGEPVYFHKQKVFVDWLKAKGYEWPNDPIDQEGIVCEFMREGLELLKAADKAE